ncbi:unnamed protein product [Rangifer tarandus platyrhynchus]|uniref:Uncharacterized protein n=1 Tax=Rangifer tarandus platyrhynchus TaxID=3082113 RepID=A0AC60A3S2_RANTA
MSLDRYLAICKPLHYTTIMNLRTCCLLVTACFALGFTLMAGLVVKVSQLSFCGPQVIPHFFCDLGPLIQLSCSDTSCVFIYMKPKQVNRLDSNKAAALVNMVVTPLMNPVIYTLWNKQVHQALRETRSGMKLSRLKKKKIT